MNNNCVFCKIIEGSEPAWKLYEDAVVIAFHDKYPFTIGHVITAIKHHKTSIVELSLNDFTQLTNLTYKLSITLSRIIKVDTISIMSLGGIVSHYHFHLVPNSSEAKKALWNKFNSFSQRRQLSIEDKEEINSICKKIQKEMLL